MDLELNKPIGAQVNPVQEVKLAKLGLDLYLGQALKATVLNQLSNNEVTLNINGQNLNAKTSHHFNPGESLELKVVNTEDEITLQIQNKEAPNTALQKTALQTALLQALPKQAPPTTLLDNLSKLVDSGKLPPALNQQVKNLLASVTTLTQLPQQLPKAVSQSGVFLESSLLNWKPGTPTEGLQTDYKSQFLKLLDSFPSALKSSSLFTSTTNQESNAMINRDSLPLPGAIPQPLRKEDMTGLVDKPPQTIQEVIHEQVSQALSRITANQINHLNAQDDNKNGFLIMMDIPIKTSEKNIDVVPLMIKQRKPSTPTEPAQWTMSFAVSLSQLGDIQGTVSIQGDAVNVKMNTENNETINTLYEFQGEMSNLLGELGLRLHDFNIQLGLENNKINTENLHLLDIRI